MTIAQRIITIAICVFATQVTRFLPFLVFSSNKPAPKYIDYLGKALPSAIFGMLVVYCLKGVNVAGGNHGMPELISIAVTVLLHLWKRKALISIAGGTVCYMVLIRLVF